VISDKTHLTVHGVDEHVGPKGVEVEENDMYSERYNERRVLK
jgi:hypothetical protein